ncbi:UNVERIFIED_CONTAM: hypothetical protein K2H54_048032 [Gekko kuhli]
MASEDLAGHLLNPYTHQNSTSAASLDFEPDVDYQFVESLEERYKCALCHLVLHNPHQTVCGHRFCQRCITSLKELNTVPTCPVDKEIIKLKEDHLQQCLFERVQCVNEGCCEKVLQKNLKEHTDLQCCYRKELCQYCNQLVILINLQVHEKTDCPCYPLTCPHGCKQIILTREVESHIIVCPEVEIDCPYKPYGCLTKIKRGKLSEHENISLREHMLRILDKNSKLEDQV